MDFTLLFFAASLAQGLPQGLLDSVCWQESKHNPSAFVKHDGGSPSTGLCQVKKTTCDFVGVHGDLKDAATNIDCAARYLRWQVNRYKGDYIRAVCAYNRGKSTGNGYNAYTRAVINDWAHRRAVSDIEYVRQDR